MERGTERIHRKQDKTGIIVRRIKLCIYYAKPFAYCGGFVLCQGVIIERLRKAGLQFEGEAAEGPQSDKLAGMSIVISGTFSQHSRDEYKALIEAHGGKNVGSVSKKTSFILAGDNMGPEKRKKAEDLGIKLMTEDEFLEMIQ